MKKSITFFGFLSLFLVFSCSTRKNTFINRNYHSLTTKYNVLFNGKEAFKKGIEEINAEHQDDFWEILSIEPITFKREELIKNTSLGKGFGAPELKSNPEENATSFDRAEEKAVKAIQKHSMNLYGNEKNPQIDNAYLLLGKSRYYTQRFVPAIEAFNYIVTNYQQANLINETKIWRAKSNIRLDNPEFATETLTILLKNSDLSDEIKEQANTALAMAYMKMDSLHLVKKALRASVATKNNKTQAARNLFVLGQLYHFENKRDSATMVFKELTNFKQAPYKYRIQAEVEIAKNVTSDSAAIAVQKKLNKLIKNRDNRPYLDKLYYQVAVLEESRDSIDKAIVNYKKSLQAKNGSPKQKTFTYENLANIYFKQQKYITASNYYDSVLVVAKDKENLRIKKVERKVKNLASLIKNENTLKSTDSILRLVALSDNDRKALFQRYIDSLKKQDELLAQQKLNAISFGNSFGGSKQSNSKGKWYFYNPQSVGFGKAEFERVWGNRPLEDNWRWSDKTQINSKKQDSVVNNQQLKRYDISTYLSTIPSSKTEIDSLKSSRNNALFELGIIYKEQFKNKPKAIHNLERLLTLEPQKKYIIPANYHLYQMYAENNNRLAEKYKNNVINSDPESAFAKAILYPNKKITKEDNVDEVADLYKIAYNLYKDNAFNEAVCFIDMSLQTLDESILIPKFALLKAYAIGKYQSKENYKKALEEVAQKYPNLEEGKKAFEILTRLKN